MADCCGFPGGEFPTNNGVNELEPTSNQVAQPHHNRNCEEEGTAKTNSSSHH
jgi:hypothetical protein